MVQKVSTTFLDETRTIENTSYNTETRTYSITSETTYNSLVIPNNVIFNVNHPITVLGNLVVPNGSTINGKKKITVKETLVIEKKGILVASGENLVFNNLIVDGKMEINGKFTTENNPLVTVKGELKIIGTFGTIQEGEFTLKNGATLEVIGTFEDNKKATFTIEEGAIYIVNGNTLIKDMGGNRGLLKRLPPDSRLENIPLGKMNFADLYNYSIQKDTSSAQIHRGISLKNANLRNTDFREVRYYTDGRVIDNEVNFSGANLSDAHFNGAKLSGAIFINANLTGARLLGADFDNANFSDANLTGVRISRDNEFRDTIFKNAKTGPVDLFGMSKEDLEKVNSILTSNHQILGATIYSPHWIISANVNASGAELSNVNIHNTRIKHLDGIILDNADLSGADLSGISMKNASMKNANLTGANLSNLDMTTIDITGANMTNAIMNSTDITGRDLTNTIIKGDIKGLKTGNNSGTPILSSKHALINGYIVGENVDLTNADLKTADLTDISLKGAILTNVDMSEATLTNLKSGNIERATGLKLPSGYIFSPFINNFYGGSIVGPGVDLIDTYFLKVGDIDFRNVNFAGTNLTGVTFDNFDLTNADFTDAIFKNVYLKNSNLTDANLSKTTIIELKTSGELGSPNLPGTYTLETVQENEDRIFGPYVKLENDNFKPPIKWEKNLNLSNLNMDYSNFKNSDFSGHTFDDGRIQLTDFTRSSLVQANLKNTKLHEINFTETDLSIADFSGANLENVIFFYANISGTDFSNVSNFKNIKSEGLIFDENTKFPPGCRVENGIFVGPHMNLVKANLQSADLADLSFAGSDLTGANIQGANIINADFREVTSLLNVTTGLHPYDVDYNSTQINSGGVQFPVDYDKFSMLTPLLPRGYAFALGYIFGPNLTLLGEDLAWIEDHKGSLIPEVSYTRGGYSKYRASQLNTVRWDDAHQEAWPWVTHYDDKVEHREEDAQETIDAIYGTTTKVLKPEWEKKIGTRNPTFSNLQTRYIYYQHRTKKKSDGTPLTTKTLTDDMLHTIQSVNVFIIAGISLKNTVFKVDSIYNVFFICDLENTNWSTLGDSGFKQSAIVKGSMNVDTLILQPGYAVYNDFIFGPNMYLKNVEITGTVKKPVDLSGIDFRGSVLDGMKLTRVDISRANVDECDFTNVEFTYCKAVQLRGTPASRDPNKHKVDYDDDTNEPIIVLGPIVPGTGLPSHIRFHKGYLLGSRFDYTNETIYGDRHEYLNFRNINFKNSQFQGAQLAYVDFRWSDLEGCQFIGTRCRWVDLTYANIQSANLSNMILRHSDARKTNFQYSILRGAEFWDTAFDHRTVFNSADLQGTDFSWTTWNDRANRYVQNWDGMSFAQVYEFATPALIDDSWKKENDNKINVANSYWIAGSIRSFRKEYDNINWKEFVSNDDGTVNNPQTTINGNKIFQYGFIIGADAGVSFDISTEYVGSYTYANVLIDPLEAYGPDYMTRYYPPAEVEGTTGVQNRHRINYLPAKPDGKKEFLPLGTKGDFKDVWGGWEYDNNVTQEQLVKDCFHIPRIDHYHIANNITVHPAGSSLSRGKRVGLHEDPYWPIYTTKSIHKSRAYSRSPNDDPVLYTVDDNTYG